ncbi:hypothetical protein E2562_007633 [Oryza meyeriana var. granulata]|uniref:Uncharacterized protein n=1 Tax=Oryza meyeriana var. granulata TaxID=110450 RepID=A0A6G1DVA7_9ORYZ|nr:hypothetical protein E2562_007633 [Oryza meyeriana var. granulata]
MVEATVGLDPVKTIPYMHAIEISSRYRLNRPLPQEPSSPVRADDSTFNTRSCRRQKEPSSLVIL